MKFLNSENLLILLILPFHLFQARPVVVIRDLLFYLSLYQNYFIMLQMKVIGEMIIRMRMNFIVPKRKKIKVIAAV